MVIRRSTFTARNGKAPMTALQHHHQPSLTNLFPSSPIQARRNVRIEAHQPASPSSTSSTSSPSNLYRNQGGDLPFPMIHNSVEEEWSHSKTQRERPDWDFEIRSRKHESEAEEVEAVGVTKSWEDLVSKAEIPGIRHSQTSATARSRSDSSSKASKEGRVEQQGVRMTGARMGGQRFDWRRRAISQLGKTKRPDPSMSKASVLNQATMQVLMAQNKQGRMVLRRKRPSETMKRGEEPKPGFRKAIQKKGKKASSPPTLMEDRSKGEGLGQGMDARKYEMRALSEKAEEYRTLWETILAHEREENRRELEERRKSPIDVLVKQGIALDGLLAYWQSNNQRRFGKRVAVFKYPASQELPRNHFKAGDKVTVIPSQPPHDPRSDDGARNSPEDLESAWERQRMPAEVVDIGATQIRLGFEEEFEKADLISSPSWRLDQGNNDITDNRIDQALKALDDDVGYIESRDTDTTQYILSGTPISDVILGVKPPCDRVITGAFHEDERIRSWYERYSRSDPIVIQGDPALGLNESQTMAVATMLKERVSLVQGPPGTGKTKTIVSAIRLLKAEFQVPHPILLAAHTNVAVDNLAEGCLKEGLEVVRVGPSARARKSLEDITLEARMARHPLKPKLDSAEGMVKRMLKKKNEIEAVLAMMRSKKKEQEQGQGQEEESGGKKKVTNLADRKRGTDEEDSDLLAERVAEEGEEDPGLSSRHDDRRPSFDLGLSGKEELQEVRRRIRELYGTIQFYKNLIRGEILNGVDVICSSSIASGSCELDMIDLPIVLFDEGSMATEPVSLIPLMKGCRQLCIIGDHKQLPPVVSSAQAKRLGLNTSLFERLIRDGVEEVWMDRGGADRSGTVGGGGGRGVKSTMLNVQFRMHPSIADFPNKAFYDGALVDGQGTERIQKLESAFLAAFHPPSPSSPSSPGSGQQGKDEGLGLQGSARSLPTGSEEREGRGGGGVGGVSLEATIDDPHHHDLLGQDAFPSNSRDPFTWSERQQEETTRVMATSPDLQSSPTITTTEATDPRTQGPSPKNLKTMRRLEEGHEAGGHHHLTFVSHQGKESKAENHSLKNFSEARIVFEMVVDLLERNADLKGEDIGIVTPYAGQVNLLESVFRDPSSPSHSKRSNAISSWFEEARNRFGGMNKRISELYKVETHTVDGFEGREKKVIVFSTVRTSPHGFVGFLADSRRLNVALTRSQSCLLVVGNIETFERARLSDETAGGRVDQPDTAKLRLYAEYLKERDLVIPVEQARELTSSSSGAIG
ncbi:P-loop containing nucleoside triphosphate hydrolase protein [Violaceomyces palustris]|uniref:P-loop containing nucleoside triphosphate hydrolase protein n=1 Tax=Violaceomyces palustris TaxID=1673888 RepID=A0ACD0NWU6_9BASI|nr:P-loop containing nucleoside triphosphate hydrolase protein [Violaceomyces palustris]